MLKTTARLACLAGLLSASPALASEAIPVRGPSQLSHIDVADGFAVDVWAQLHTRVGALRFAAREDAPFPAIVLEGRDCELRLEDRDRDGRFETERARRHGQPTSRCDAAPGAPAQLESGADADPLRDCIFQTTSDYRVVCQPTRFGRAAGEPWTVAAGWTDRFQQQSRGRPDALFWEDGLLILDGPSGVIYRVAQLTPSDTPPSKSPPGDTPTTGPTVDPAPSGEIESGRDGDFVAVEGFKADRPNRPTRSRLQTGETGVSKERQRVLDDRARAFGRSEKPVGPTPEPD